MIFLLENDTKVTNVTLQWNHVCKSLLWSMNYMYIYWYLLFFCVQMYMSEWTWSHMSLPIHESQQSTLLLVLLHHLYSESHDQEEYRFVNRVSWK